MTDYNKQNGKGQQKKFSEDEIKKKLYGGLKPSEEPQEPKERRVEAKIQQKLYGSMHPPVPEVAAEDEKTLFTEPVETKKSDRKKVPAPAPEKELLQVKKDQLLAEEGKVRQRIMDELSLLKDTIGELENKLRKSEEQKERIKRKFLQRKRIELIAGRAVKPLQDRGNDKLFVLIPAVIIIILLIVIMSMRSQIKQTTAPPAAKPAPMTTAKPQQKKPAPEPAASIAPTATFQPESDKEYTIQVAEYAQQEAADRFIVTLKDQGFDVYVSTTYRNNDKTKPYFKVMVGQFGSFDDAKQFNLQFQQKTGIKDSFIREKR